MKSTESLALTVLRKILDRVIEGDVALVKGIFPRPLATYLLNHKRRELTDIEGEFHVQIWITGQWEMALDRYVLEFMTRSQLEGVDATTIEGERELSAPETIPSLPRLEEEVIKKPWYLKILGR